MKRQFLILMVIAWCCAGCRVVFESVVPTSSMNELIATETFEGVIFTADNAAAQYIDAEFGIKLDYWTPTRDQVIELENMLIPFLESELSPDDYRYGFWEEGNLNRYKRQYFGLIFEGQQVIYANYFCDVDFIDDWRESYVVVADGGSCFFNVMVDVETGEFSRLRINGEA